MYLLKRARQTDGAIMGDAVPLAHLRTLVDLVPRSGKAANRQLAKETVWSAAQNSGLISILRKNSFMPQKNASRFPTCTKSKSFNPLFCVGHYCADAPLAGTPNELGVFLESPNVDAFGVSVVFLAGKSRPTFVVDQRQSSCSHCDHSSGSSYRLLNPSLLSFAFAFVNPFHSTSSHYAAQFFPLERALL
jgi:hypothetical protein